MKTRMRESSRRLRRISGSRPALEILESRTLLSLFGHGVSHFVNEVANVAHDVVAIAVKPVEQVTQAVVHAAENVTHNVVHEVVTVHALPEP